ncbi:hypothetical protein AB0M11_03295 [Streptomyces sp. NPDC051987]|uniref:hypothetical protein n=1 Tax=Streptomyces sp. NPDC051987 TaxID=3155808 RepID=UPI0034258B55
MTKLVSLPSGRPEENLDWFATSALFEDAAAFVLRYVTDDRARRDLTADVASGYVFVDRLPEPDRTTVLTALRDVFPGHVDTEIYPPRVTSLMDDPETFVARAKSLALLAGRSLALREASAAVPDGARDRPHLPSRSNSVNNGM